VGSGPGGSTAADVLAAAGRSVCVLEKGRNHLLAFEAPYDGLGHLSSDEVKFTRRHFLGPDPLREPRTYRRSTADGMRYVERAGAVDRFHYPLLKNTLAVVVPVGRSLPGTTAAVLADPSVRRIAIADPAAVPAGFYARKFLQHEGQWERLQPKLVALANVRAALAAVESGGVDAGIVYESDTAMSNKVSIAFRVPEQMTGPIIYPIALVKRTRNAAEAQRFIAYLRFNDKAHQIFRRHRFRPYETTH
jgi:molybdenum ABC transporter molybdate-binding protein